LEGTGDLPAARRPAADARDTGGCFDPVGRGGRCGLALNLGFQGRMHLPNKVSAWLAGTAEVWGLHRFSVPLLLEGQLTAIDRKSTVLAIAANILDRNLPQLRIGREG
jgi:hypothetical protein